jgi:Ca2+-binding RTX toxin-like protein
MASISHNLGFSTESFWLARQGNPSVNSATTYRFQNTSGLYIEVIGTGLTYNGFDPLGGNYTAINVFATSAYNGTPIATLTSATAIAFSSFFTSGLATALSGGDSITGSTANDTLRGGNGTDTMNGGEGNDTFLLSTGENGVGETFNGGGATDTIHFTSTTAGLSNFNLADDTLTSIERFLFSNTTSANITSAQAAAMPSLIVDFGAALTSSGVINISGAAPGGTLDLSGWTILNDIGEDSFITVQSSTALFNDTFIGTSARDLLYGENGNDWLEGRGGNDYLDGGLGVDTLVGGAGNDQYVINDFFDVVAELPNGGIDIIYAQESYFMPANVENLLLFGSAVGAGGNDLPNEMTGNSLSNGMAGGLGNDTMRGEAGDDVLDGQQGSDLLIGGTGIDTYFVDNTGDVVVEDFNGGEYDTIWTMVSYTLPANVEIIILDGGILNTNATGNNVLNLMLGNDGINTLLGFAGNDVILGQGGNDVIDAGADNDFVAGGVGADTLTGGTGNDYFIWTAMNEGGDLITDLTTTPGPNLDILDMRYMWSTVFSNTGGITTVAQAVTSGHLTYTQSGANVLFFADANGGANSNVLMATLQNTTVAGAMSVTLI